MPCCVGLQLPSIPDIHFVACPCPEGYIPLAAGFLHKGDIGDIRGGLTGYFNATEWVDYLHTRLRVVGVFFVVSQSMLVYPHEDEE